MWVKNSKFMLCGSFLPFRQILNRPKKLCSIQIGHSFFVNHDLEHSRFGSKIVHTRLPYRLYTALPDGDDFPIGKQELGADLLDMIHIHQKTLMTAQEAPVPKLFLYSR